MGGTSGAEGAEECKVRRFDGGLLVDVLRGVFVVSVEYLGSLHVNRTSRIPTISAICLPTWIPISLHLQL